MAKYVSALVGLAAAGAAGGGGFLWLKTPQNLSEIELRAAVDVCYSREAHYVRFENGKAIFPEGYENCEQVFELYKAQQHTLIKSQNKNIVDSVAGKAKVSDH